MHFVTTFIRTPSLSYRQLPRRARLRAPQRRCSVRAASGHVNRRHARRRSHHRAHVPGHELALSVAVNARSSFAPDAVSSISRNSRSPISATRCAAIDDLAAVEVDVLLLPHPQRRVGRQLQRRRGRAAVRRSAAGREARSCWRRRRPGRWPTPGRSPACPCRRIPSPSPARRTRRPRRGSSCRPWRRRRATSRGSSSGRPALLPGDGLLFISPFSRVV